MPNHNVRHSSSTDRQPATPTQNPLQPAPGLPARPSFELPNFNREDMQRMHTGQVPPPSNNAAKPKPAYVSPFAGYLKPLQTDEEVFAMLQDAKDEFKSKQATEAAANASAQETAAESASKATAEESAATSSKKKKQNRPGMLVFTDDHESPEEKRAKWSKYLFKRDDGPEFVEGEVGGAVTGVTVDEDTVLDVQD